MFISLQIPRCQGTGFAPNQGDYCVKPDGTKIKGSDHFMGNRDCTRGSPHFIKYCYYYCFMDAKLLLQDTLVYFFETKRDFRKNEMPFSEKNGNKIHFLKEVTSSIMRKSGLVTTEGSAYVFNSKY